MSKLWDEHGKVLTPLLLALAFVLILLITGTRFSMFDNSQKRKTYKEYPKNVLEEGKDYKAEVIIEAEGTIKIDLYEKDTPNAVNNFVFLTNEKYYNKMKIHSIIKNTLVQSGDPKSDGTGGPGYVFNDEILDQIKIKQYSVAYANSGANTNGSQYFLVCGDVGTDKLEEWNGKFTVFGEVYNGKEILDRICKYKTVDNTPVKELMISEVKIVIN